MDGQGARNADYARVVYRLTRWSPTAICAGYVRGGLMPLVASALLPGAQQREGVLKALLEDLIGELPVG